MKKCLISLAAALIVLSGCTSDPMTGEQRMSNAGLGATMGAASGALLGSMANNSKGAIIGAGLGAVAGSMIGNSVDRQESMLRAELRSSGVSVVRTRDDIRLIMPGDITFSNNSATINPSFYRTLNSVSVVLRRFNATTIRIAGHSSNSGAAMHNQLLSEQRATAVAEYLNSQGINPNRIFAIGYGSRYPLATNANADGQAVNRRVEITIHPIG